MDIVTKLTAKQFKAIAIDEQAKATEELIAALTEAHTKQMETLIKSTTETMKEMMLLIKDNKNPTNPTKLTDEEKKKKRNEKRKKYNDAVGGIRSGQSRCSYSSVDSR